MDDLEDAVDFSAEATDVSSRAVSLGLAISVDSVNAAHTGIVPLCNLVTNCVEITVT